MECDEHKNKSTNDEGKEEVKLRKKETQTTMQQTKETPKQKHNEQRAKGVVCVSTIRTSPFLTIAGFVNRNHSQYL